MATEARLVINRDPPDPDKATGRLTQANRDQKITGEQIRARRKEIHNQAKMEAAGVGAPEAEESVAAPEREDLDSIEVTLRDGRLVEYGPPHGISLSDRIARMYSARSIAEGGPDPGITEYRLTRLLMGVRSVAGKPISIHNLIDRTRIANLLGDEGIDLLNIFDNRYWPPLRESEIPLVKKNIRQS